MLPNDDSDSQPTKESRNPSSSSSLTLYKWLCPEGTGYGLTSTDYAITCTQEHLGVAFELTHDGGVIAFQSDTSGLRLDDLSGDMTIRELQPAGYGDPVVFCGALNEPESTLYPSTNGVVVVSAAPGKDFQCFWYNIPAQSDAEDSTNDKKATSSSGAVDATTYQCKSTPPRGADYGWFNKNCVAVSGTSLELNTGQKDGVKPLQPTRSPVGYAVDKNVPAGTYLLTEARGSPLKIHAVWCATLKPDQMSSPSDYVAVPISRAGISIEVPEDTWVSCKLFGPGKRGHFDRNDHFSNANILQYQQRKHTSAGIG